MSLGAPSRQSVHSPPVVGGDKAEADTKGNWRCSVNIFFPLFFLSFLSFFVHIFVLVRAKSPCAKVVYSQPAIGCGGLKRGTKAVIGSLITINPSLIPRRGKKISPYTHTLSFFRVYLLMLLGPDKETLSPPTLKNTRSMCSCFYSFPNPPLPLYDSS